MNTGITTTGIQENKYSNSRCSGRSKKCHYAIYNSLLKQSRIGSKYPQESRKHKLRY